MMTSRLTWSRWRLPHVRYAALVGGEGKNRNASTSTSTSTRRSSSSGRGENRGLLKENHDANLRKEDSENTQYMRPPKTAYRLVSLRVVILCLAFMSCGALLGYAARGLYIWHVTDSKGAVANKTAWGKEYNKYIYAPNEYDEYFCPDEDLTMRLEWRKMSRIEKRQFVQAVKCLKFKPSKARATGTLFEDFAFLRGQIGLHTIGVASFFPWHRYLLWVFERELKNTCGYLGGIPFWDWTKDSDALAYSSLLNELPGFGSDGNPQADFANGTHGGYCVTDGNFANHMTTIDYNDTSGVTTSSHCVSRRFDPEDSQGSVAGALISSSIISDIIALPDFASFSTAMLNKTTGPVVAIPNWVHGDMAQYTAPNDVLYMLHLAQVDRIWWIWQHQVTALRLNDYTGLRRNDLDDPASIHNTLSLGMVLAPDVEVYDAMWAQWSFMCYTYYAPKKDESR